MKTAVSIPDELFHLVDELARLSGKSRSQVYQEALSEYLLRRDQHSVTSTMDEALTALGESGTDEWAAEAGRRVLERTEWQ